MYFINKNLIQTKLLGTLPKWLVVGLLALLTACAESVPSLPRLPVDAVILAFGDSLTRGNGATLEQAYPAVLASLSGRRVINAGVPGEITAEGLARLPQLLEDTRPRLLVLCHGGNDLLRKLEPETVAANLRGMIEAARARRIPVVLIGVPKPRLVAMQPPAFYRELAQDYALPYDGKILAALEADRSFKSDSIHLNAAGYRRLAEAVHQLLIDSGAL